MVRSCSITSMVSRPYETRNKTVSTGRSVRLGLMATLSPVWFHKMAPRSRPRNRRAQYGLQLVRQRSRLLYGTPGKELRGVPGITRQARKCKLLHIIGNRDGLPRHSPMQQSHDGQGFWAFSALKTVLRLAYPAWGTFSASGSITREESRISSRAHFLRRLLPARCAVVACQTLPNDDRKYQNLNEARQPPYAQKPDKKDAIMKKFASWICLMLLLVTFAAA